MAANKDSNSSKTAHVMSLLSKNRGGASTPETSAEADSALEAASAPQAASGPEVAAAETAPAHNVQVPPLISSLEADAAVASQIKDALELELDMQSAQEAPAAPPEPPKAAVPEKAPAPPPVEAHTHPDEEASADELMGIPQPSPSAPREPEMDLPAAPPAVREPESQAIAYTNVMQILVEEKAEKYMKMFGLCCCEQCQVDVKSYTLNHLPPKYVVMAPDERVPKLTVYESKFSSDITAQLIQACKVVMNTPHHTR